MRYDYVCGSSTWRALLVPSNRQTYDRRCLTGRQLRGDPRWTPFVTRQLLQLPNDTNGAKGMKPFAPFVSFVSFRSRAVHGPPPGFALPKCGSNHSRESLLCHLQPLPANGQSHRIRYRGRRRQKHDVPAHGGRAPRLRAQRPNAAIFIRHCARMHNSSLERGLPNGLV